MRTRAGPAQGRASTLNLPLPRGTDWAAYEPALDRALAAIAAYGTRFLVVSFGADTFADDPISYFALQRADFTRMACRLAATDLPTVIGSGRGLTTGWTGVHAGSGAAVDEFTGVFRRKSTSRRVFLDDMAVRVTVIVILS